MKSTGVVRRIDELGRIVIPKEIRRTLHIHEGDPLEIYTDAEGGVMLKKYSQVGDLASFAQQYADVLAKYINLPMLVCDLDSVVSVAGAPKNEYLARPITPVMEEYIQDRKHFISDGKSDFKPVVGVDQVASVICPIIAASEVTGAVVLLKNDRDKLPEQTEITLVQVAATFLGKQME